MNRVCAFAAICFGVFVVPVCGRSDGPLEPLFEHIRSHSDGDAPWSIDFRALEGDRSALPIGVFDSGIGGLTVMEALLTLDAFNNETLQPGADGIPDFAGERFIYFGDQANMPYGNYPAEGKTDYLRELIVKDAVFLLGPTYHRANRESGFKSAVKAIVIACNTATAFGLEDVRAALQAGKLDIPVIGVVEAGARAVSEHLPANQKAAAVAVLATVGTCNANAYPKAIGRATGLAGKPLPTILQRGSVALAGAIEGNPAFVASPPLERAATYLGPSMSNEQQRIDPLLLPAYQFDPAGLLGDPARPETWQLNSVTNYARYDVTMLVEQYREADGGIPIGTVVLGCTHFPIIQREIADAFAQLREYRNEQGKQPYRELIGATIDFVSPAEFTAKELFRTIARERLRRQRGKMELPMIGAAFISVPNPACPGVELASDGSFHARYKYGRAAGHPALEDTWCIPMEETSLPMESLAGLARSLPVTWKQLRLPRR
jgi:glutamate racemase